MTTHTLTCTHCGHRLESENLEDLINVRRTCPICEHSSWELHERDTYPCSIREQRFIYQKLLHVGKWCVTEKACESGGYCPLKPYCDGENYSHAFLRWIMGADV